MKTLDERLSQALRAIDVPADFETRLMARVHAEQTARTEERVAAARTWAQQNYDAAGRELRLWRRAALRMLTLDALGAVTLLIVLMIALPRVAPRVAAFGASYAPLLIALGVALFGAAILFSPLPRLRGRGLG